MSTEIKADLVDSKSVELKTRRTFFTMEINARYEFIKVFYIEETYYTIGLGENAVDTVTSSETKDYNADFEVWKAGATGLAIISTLEAELAKEVPGSVESE